MRTENVISYIASQPWAVTEDRWRSLEAVVASFARGEHLSETELRAQLSAYQDDEEEETLPKASAARQGSIAVLPVRGDLSPYVSPFMEYLGMGTSCAKLCAAVRQFAADPNVSTILLDIYSAGGNVYGIHELFMELMRARQTGTKVKSQVNPAAGSAAYWLAAAGDEIICTPSGEAGSIGVFTVHLDLTGAMEKAGVKATIIKAGKFKGETDSRVALTEEAQAALQKRADAYYDLFVGDVAAGRGTTPAKVRAGYGQGRMLGARDAKAEGLVDRIATMQETIDRLLGRNKKSAAATAATVIEPDLVAADETPEPIQEPADPTPADPAPEPVGQGAAGAAAALALERQRWELL